MKPVTLRCPKCKRAVVLKVEGAAHCVRCARRMTPVKVSGLSPPQHISETADSAPNEPPDRGERIKP